MTKEAATTTQETPKKPSWGRVIGMFFACWTLCFCANFFLTWIMLGYPERGGLIPLIVGIILAVMYRKGAFAKHDGRLSATLYLMDAAVVVGIILGIVICMVSAGIAYSYSASELHSYATQLMQASSHTSGWTSLVYTVEGQWLDAFCNGNYFIALVQFLLPSGVVFFIGSIIVHGIGKVVEIASRD